MLSLLRLYYSIPFALTFALTVWYAAGQAPPLGSLGLATLALWAVIAGGYALNDVFDVDVDAAAGRRPIVVGCVTRRVAAWLGGDLLAAGVGLGWLLAATTGRWAFAAVLTVVALALVAYDVVSKRIGPAKQVVVAALMTSLYPLAIAFDGGATGSRAATLGPFAAWMFVSSLAYEILKDVRDRKVDALATGRRNLLQRHPRAFLHAAGWLLLTGGVALVGPAFLGCGWVYRAMLPAPVALAVAAAASRCVGRKLTLVYVEFVLVGLAATLDVIVFGF